MLPTTGPTTTKFFGSIFGGWTHTKRQGLSPTRMWARFAEIGRFVHEIVIPHLPGEGCSILSELFSSSSSSASCPPPPPPLVSPRPCLHQLPPPLPPCQLFAKLFDNSLRQALCQLPSSVCTGTSTWDLPSSVCTAGPQAQCAPLDLNQGPSQLSVHRWTSTWDLPSPVCTAGPQPGICPAQCAPLDLNRGPPQLSVHCWTSTGR